MPNERRRPTFINTDEALHVDSGGTGTAIDIENIFSETSSTPRFMPESNTLSDSLHWNEGQSISADMHVPSVSPEETIEIELLDEDIQEWKLEMNPGSTRTDTVSVVLNDGTVISGNIHEISVNPMFGTEEVIGHILFVAEGGEVVTLKLNVKKDSNGDYIWRGTKPPIKDWSKEF